MPVITMCLNPYLHMNEILRANLTKDSWDINEFSNSNSDDWPIRNIKTDSDLWERTTLNSSHFIENIFVQGGQWLGQPIEKAKEQFIITVILKFLLFHSFFKSCSLS